MSNAIHLALFMTRGMSLAQWERQGMFEREVALYRALRPQLSGLSIVTYGGESELKFQAALPGIEILPNRSGLPPRLYAAAARWLHGARLASATVLKTNQMKGAPAALAVRARTGAPVIARCGYLWSLAAASHKSSPRGWLNYLEARRTERFVFGQADAISVTAGAMKQHILGAYGVPGGRVRVIPNYVLDEFFEQAEAAEPARPASPGRILFVGRLEPDKDPARVIEAARGLNARVTMIGQGSLQPALARQAARAGVPAEFIPGVPHRELPACFRSADVFLLPSPREGHPKTLIEAMAAGLAVVGRDAPGIREVIRPGQTGLLAEGDPASLNEAVARLLGDGQLRARLGRNARDYAREHFTFDKVLEAEMKLICAVAEAGSDAA